MLKKNMKLGKINLNLFFFLLIFFLISFNSFSEEKITETPIINLDNLEPSFEEENLDDQDILSNDNVKFKEKKINNSNNKEITVNIVALDKITAKTSNIDLHLGEVKKFGFLEIKALKCGEVKSKKEPGQAAYIQIRDLSDNNNEKVFVFNGWTFSSSTTINPLDHPVYDFWLVSCENV